ncbi:MAG: hypothetical protein JNL28_11335 [Planctomycetes bacterium]|nr:hypothetical protein [Planctomycetota bacterium]
MKIQALKFGSLLALSLALGVILLARHFASGRPVSEPDASAALSTADTTLLAHPDGVLSELSAASTADPAPTTRREPAHHDPDGDATIPPASDCETEATLLASAPAAHVRTGSIRGFLVREGGPWTSENVPDGNTVMLDLVSANAERVDYRGLIAGREGPDGALELTFTFDDLPEGPYELTLSSIGNRRWAPTALNVHCPTDGIVFTCYDKDAVIPLALEVFDAANGEPLLDFEARMIQITPSRDNGVFLHTGPLVAGPLPLDARVSWSIRAPGYATAFGNETAFERSADKRTLRVGLVRGWCTQVLVLARDPTAVQARGAEVIVDGERAGFTDSNGLLVVHRALEPRSMVVKLSGWKPAHDPLASFGRYGREQRAGVTVVMLDRE